MNGPHSLVLLDLTGEKKPVLGSTVFSDMRKKACTLKISLIFLAQSGLQKNPLPINTIERIVVPVQVKIKLFHWILISTSKICSFASDKPTPGK